MKVFLTINIIIKYLLWSLLFIISINHIIAEEIFGQKRKNEAIQIVHMSIGQGVRVKVINSDYIPNRVYLNEEPAKIDISGYIEISDEERESNNITMEWDKKAKKYSKLFQNIDSAIEIDLTQFDISGIESIKSMFINCVNLQYIKFGNFDTSSVTDMASMFEGCSSLERLDLSIFNTSNVKYMEYMFRRCFSLKSLNLSNFQTPNLERIFNMFEECSYLEELDLSSFNTSLITTMEYLFSGCSTLKYINISNFDTSQVTSMVEMFSKCENLEYVDLSNFDTSNVINMNSMFYDCYNLKSLNISRFSVSKVEDLRNMFCGCSALISIDLSNFDTSEVTAMDNMFYGCSELKSIDLSSFSISQRSMSGFFYGCKALTSIKFSREYKLVGNIYHMFYDCNSLTEIDFYNFDFALNRNFESLFYGCYSLTSLDLSNIDSSLVTSMISMFYNCLSLKTLNIKNLKTSQVLFMNDMFYNCTLLTSIDLSSFNTSLVSSMKRLFYGCSKLTSINLSTFDTSLVTEMNYMFYGCSSLTSLNLSNFNTSLVNTMNSMFYGCKNLKSLNLSNFNAELLERIEYMFYGCSSLEYINIYSFSDGIIQKFENIFHGTKDNIIYCIINESNAEDLIHDLILKKCSVKDCSSDWKSKKKKIVDSKNICIDKCQYDDTYKYEYEFYCYEKCPKGTHSTKENLYICEKNIYECIAKYPFVSVKNKSCLEECSCHDFFYDICTINNLNNRNQTNLIDNIIKCIMGGLLDHLLEHVIDEQKIDVIKTANDTQYQITSSFNQNNKKYENISSIKLGECENVLKEIYDIPQNDTLIIFKTEKYIEGLLIPLIDYDIFDPKTLEKMDLNYCRNKNLMIDIIMPVSINENYLFKYDPNNSYYNDICHTYTTINNTDIILYDRRNEFNNLHMFLCENNCIYKGYDTTNKKSLCQCPSKNRIVFTQNTDINELIYKFNNTKNPTNFLVIKCYKSLFNKEIIKNIANYIILLILFINIISAILVYAKGYDLLLEQISELLDIKISEHENENHSKKDLKFDEQLKDNSTDVFSSTKKNKLSNPKNSISKSNIDTKIDSDISLNNNILNNTKKKENEKINYFDYEINTIPYQEALENDQRTNFEYYISLIKIKQIFIFTFFYSNKDYNSYIIKICLFFLYFQLNFLINTTFFNDSTMHQIYEDGGSFNFIYNIPNIIYSSIISSFLYAFIRKLTLTSKNVLEIKHEKKKHNLNARVIIALKQIKKKFICFFAFNIIFLLIIWYYISCFCAVYKNTQVYLIKNTAISYSISLIYPFIISFIPCFFRIFAFKGSGICLYRISQMIQFM